MVVEEGAVEEVTLKFTKRQSQHSTAGSDESTFFGVSTSQHSTAAQQHHHHQ
jgi:hypothetical protein